MKENPYASPAHVFTSDLKNSSGAAITETAFEFTPECWVAFSEYHRRNSPLLRWLTLSAMFLLLLFGTLLVISIARNSNRTESVFRIVAIAVVLLPAILMFPWIMRWTSRAVVRRSLSEGKNRALLGPLRVSLTEEGIQSETTLARSLYKWPAVERIAETAEYVFLYVTGLSAVVIPKRAFQSDAEWRSFIDVARHRAVDAEYLDHRTTKLGTY